MIEMEKEKSDQQSVLRWTMAGATDNRKSRAEASEKMNEAEAKRVLFRKLQNKRYKTTKLDSVCKNRSAWKK